MGLLGLLALTSLSGCHGKKSGDGTKTERKVPFDSWRDLRQALRSSPDNLAARADRLVAEADAEAIFEFVRDSISLRPIDAKGFGPGAAVAVRWDPARTLRYGVGTPREKVELLADLYRRAGFDVEVWSGTNTLTAEELRACFAPKAALPFAPSEEDVSRIEEIRLELGGGPSPKPVTPVDKDGTKSQALADRILALFPTDVAVKSSTDLSDFDTMPYVRVQIDGQAVFANPIPPDAVLGESYSSGNDGPAGDPVQMDGTVHVEVAIAKSDTPRTLETILAGDWSLSDLLGRRLRIQMVPAEDLESFLASTPDALQAFFPVLALDGPDMDPKDVADGSLASDTAITLTGKRVAVDDSGTVTVDGLPVAQGEANQSLLDQVASIELSVDPVRFPSVAVEALVRDSDGQVVSGLSASDFRLVDEEEDRGFLVERSTSSGPRLLILVDLSDSIPAAFRENVADYAHELAQTVLQDHPDAQFRVAAVGLGAEPAGDWTASPEEVRGQAANALGAGSDLWAAVSDAAELGASTVVFTTDGQADTAPTPDQRLEVAHGPPLVLVGVGTLTQATLDDMLSLAGGTVVTATTASEAAQAADSYLSAQVTVPYLLGYRAVPGTEKLHHITLATADGRVTADATYLEPETDEALPPPRITGLYVKVEYDGKSIVRPIAGFDLDPNTEPSDEDADAVAEAMFGAALLSFEGAAPTFSALLDDALDAKLSLEPLWNGASSGNKDDLLAAMADPRPSLNGDLMAIAGVLRSDGRSMPLYETGPRMVLFARRPLFGTGLTERMDILPLTGFATLASDPSQAFRETLKATAALAVMEQARFDESTMSLLADSDLVLLQPYEDIGDQVSGLDSATKNRWAHVMEPYWDWYRVVPKAATPLAFYAIDPDTGSLLALLPDGSGGGLSNKQVEQLANGSGQVFAWIGLLGGLAGGGLGLGGFIALQKAILKAILREALAVALLDATGFDLERIGRDFACDMAKEGLGDAFPVVGVLNNVDATVEGVSGQSIISCP